MKKIYILIISILCFCLVLLISLFFNTDESKEVKSYKNLSSDIIENSTWVELKESDLNSLILKTYSDNVLDIINSLENAIPVIFEVNGGQFSDTNKNNFVIVSSFNSENTVSIYLSRKDNTYLNKTTTLEEVFENATRYFISKDEVIKK